MFILKPEIAQDLEQLKQIAKRHGLATVVVSIFGLLSVVGWIGGVAGGFAIMGSWFGLGTPPESVCLESKSNLFGGSGWILVGDFSCSIKRGVVHCDDVFANEKSSVYLKSENEYSYYSLSKNQYYSSSFSLSDLQVGNNIFLKHNTKVFVNNFKSKGISDIDTPPYLDGDTLSDNDITNMILNKDDELLIQKIDFRQITERKLQIWLKVSQVK